MHRGCSYCTVFCKPCASTLVEKLSHSNVIPVFLISNKSVFWKSISSKISIKSQIVDKWVAMKYIYIFKGINFVLS